MTDARPSICSSDIRDMFSRAMSAMYQQEVPQYGTLVELVEDVNVDTLAAKPALKTELEQHGELTRLSEERHGAIRLGTAAELKTMGRLFAVMGMYPVNYYDLTVADIPVHSTAFRPLDDDALKQNPFRVFTSLLRTDLMDDADIRAEAEAALAARDIYTPRLRELIELHAAQGGLNEAEAREFVAEALETFRWHKEAMVSKGAYQRFHDVHRLAADVASFRGPHINHLTPRTLDIDEAQRKMPERGMNSKAIIEGPPPRAVPILLRQTSFKALEEEVEFMEAEFIEAGSAAEVIEAGSAAKVGAHTARFGEIEQRGAALTAKGQALYDALLNQTRARVKPAADGSNAEQYMQALTEEFQAFPDDLEAMRAQGLAYVQYHATHKGLAAGADVAAKNDVENDIENDVENDVEQLIADGYLAISPIIYEDFLPVSAAGIFTSNLGDDDRQNIQATPNQQAFEAALGMRAVDPFQLYEAKQQASLKCALKQLGRADA